MANGNLVVINECGIRVEGAFAELKTQLRCMIEASVHWLSDADLVKRLFEVGVIDKEEYDKRCNALVDGPGNGLQASFDEAYDDAKLCIDRCLKAIKSLDKINEDLVQDPHERRGLTPCDEF